MRMYYTTDMVHESRSFSEWSHTHEAVASALTTHLVHGLAEEEATVRLTTYGPNEFEQTDRNTKLRIIFRQLKSPLIFILIAAMGVTLYLDELFDAAIIFISIAINTFLGFYQENKAENAIAHLRSYIQVRTRVVRDGREHEEDARDIVPGDLIHLTPGGRIPADARLISVNGLRVDESILTGESLPVEKMIEVLPESTPVVERHNMVFGGTLVAEGTGMAIVTATGLRAEFGKIAKLVASTESEQTPIQKAVSRLAWIIAVGITVFVVWIFMLGVSRGESIAEMFLVSIAVAVGAIPEALPIGLTAILAVGVERLAKRKGVMRSLTAAETLGSTSVVMTDKTGTLTEANMQLVDIKTTQEMIEGESRGSALGAFSPAHKEVLTLALLGSDVLIENPDDVVEEWRMSGSPLETNIVRAAALHGIEVSHARTKRESQLILPFNSTNKFSVSSTLHSVARALLGKKSGSAYVVLGAPDVLLLRAQLTKDEYHTLQRAVFEASAEGKRLLGVAICPAQASFSVSALKKLQFVGVLAFFDPVRKEVPDAVRKIEGYGVRVVMATGDLKGTAVAVAHSIGWTIAEDEVLTGDDLQILSDDALSELLHRIKIFARVTPQDKLRIAQLFQRRGEIVAMTGDGVNDAPSLKVVDIGIAVGSGSDVAKGVADLVLLDNNFNTIVAAIEEGKRVLRNIRKTFVYLMSNSLDEVILIGGSLLLGLSLPLTAIQIIWVNFFTGGLPAIAFAFDNEGGSRMTGRNGDRAILNREVKVLTLGIGTVSSLLLFSLYWGLSQFSIDQETVKTFVFVCFASYILFIAFSFRSLEKSILSYNPFGNKFLLFGVSFGILLLGLTMYVPFLQEIFSTTALHPIWLFFLVLWIIFNLFLAEITKWFFYRRR